MTDIIDQSASEDITRGPDTHTDVIQVSDLLAVQQLSRPNMADSCDEPPSQPHPPSQPTSLTEADNQPTCSNHSDSSAVCFVQNGADVRLIESLSNEVEVLRLELVSSRSTIMKMHERENELRDRLSEQAQRQLEKRSTKFEDITLGENRPTELIKRYGNLYAEGRLEAMDALDDLDEMSDCDDLKTKLLLSVIVLAFRSAQHTLYEMRTSVREILHIPHVVESTKKQHHLAALELEETISVYLKKTVDRHDLTKNFDEVCERVWATLFDYPLLRDCAGLLQYIEESVRLAWALTLQNPPLVIDYESKEFNEELHTRFHASDADCDHIRTVLWPMLLEGENGPCVYRGVVQT